MDHLGEGVLAAVVEGKEINAWLTIIPRAGDEQARHLAYELWSGFLGLFDKAVHAVEALVTERSGAVVEICLDLSNVIVPEDISDGGECVEIEAPVWSKFDSNQMTITMPEGLFLIFNQPANRGERYILNALIRGLLALCKSCEADQLDSDQIKMILDKIIGNEGARVLHLFASHDPVEYLMTQRNRRPVFLAHEDSVFSKLKLSYGCADDGVKRIRDKGESRKFLHTVVDKLWGQIKGDLARLNRESVISELFYAHEAILYDREHWRRTALALISLYDQNDEGLRVANKREGDRTHTSLPIRALIEMALCECPMDGGRPMSNWDRDDLIAKTALLIETASGCDAIHYELIDPEIILHPNGEYTLQRDFQEDVIKPFLNSYTEEQIKAASRYDRLYENSPIPEKTDAKDMYSPAFLKAFETEFGLSVDEFADCVAELFDLAIEKDCVVVQVPVAEVRSRLISKRGLPSDAVVAFLQAFALYRREHWENPPDGFSENDIWPWRLQRRLSLTYRPIVILDSNENSILMYGIGGLKQGYINLLDRIEQGQLPHEFFQSHEMKSFLASVAAEKGHAFEKSVAEEFRSHGWKARSEVNMSELEAPPMDADGDIDVLAWRDSGEILIIECKRLQLAKSVAEIAKVCKRFSGEAKDKLDKHIRRVEWIRRHPESLGRVIGWRPAEGAIDSRLITNTHVPMMYLENLPYPAEKIGPLRWKGDDIEPTH